MKTVEYGKRQLWLTRSVHVMKSGPRQWGLRERERLRREMGLARGEFERLRRTEIFSIQLRWLVKYELFSPTPRMKVEDQRMEFLQRMARAVKRRRWYRWEKVSFSL